MYYSIHILQDALAGLTYELCCGADERRFSRVDLLPRAPALVHEDCLYVSLLSRALDFRAQGGTAFVLCLRDRFKDDGEQSLSDMIVVSENISLDELFSKVQESFLQLNEWIDNMHRVLVNDGDFQELLNLSEEMLGNTINISDSALTLLACTRGIPTDDESSLLLRQYGYHPESSIARFRKNRSFQRWQLAGNHIEVRPANSSNRYSTLWRVFRREKSSYFIHIIMLCDHKAYTPALYDLFRILVDNVEVCVKRRERRDRENDDIAGSVISSIISGTVWRPQDIRTRALSAGLPLEGEFSLMTITPPDYASTVTGRLEQELKSLFPEAFMAQYLNEIIVLHPSPCQGKAALSELLMEYDARCGVSMTFRTIEELQNAYQQTLLSMRYCPVFKGVPLLGKAVFQQHARISDYRNGLLFYLLGSCEEAREIWKASFYGKLVLQLREADERNGTERLKLLYCYLICQTRATETGNMLHMNRNNVVYHITRLEEQYSLDLSDPNEQFNLLLSCCALQLFGSQ